MISAQEAMSDQTRSHCFSWEKIENSEFSTNAVIKMCSGYLKLLYPHVRSASDISPQEFKMVCFDPAFEKRKIIRQQLAAIDREFTDRMPDIRVRGL